jgi:hypothetical protein
MTLFAHLSYSTGTFARGPTPTCGSSGVLMYTRSLMTMRGFNHWNGETCDLKWLWKITQAPGSRCSLPQQIKFFIDPFRVVGYFKTCPINKTKSKTMSGVFGSSFQMQT